MTDGVIRTQALCRYFGDVKAVDKLDLDVKSATIYGFLGPNGSGKTTAMRLISGLLRPTSGTVEVLGLPVPEKAEKLKHLIGYMTQKFSLYDDLTVVENFEFIAAIYGLNPNRQKKRIEELLSLYGLVRQRHRLAGSMSGGQRQRLALAAAVLHEPKILLLDEPTSAVDPENRRDFWEKLFDLSEQGTSILVSTHYMDEAERCHQLAIMAEGVKRADGSPKDLMQQMDAWVVEISAPGLRQLKTRLLGVDGVMSAAQQGAYLRVLVGKHIADPVAYLEAQELGNGELKLALVRPSLEDVFVSATGRIGE